METATHSPIVQETTQKREGFTPPVIEVLLQPEEKRLTLPRPKTARQLLAALGLREETALVVRDGQLLTPDRAIYTNDSVLVRKVTSSG